MKSKPVAWIDITSDPSARQLWKSLGLFNKRVDQHRSEDLRRFVTRGCAIFAQRNPSEFSFATTRGAQGACVAYSSCWASWCFGSGLRDVRDGPVGASYNSPKMRLGIDDDGDDDEDKDEGDNFDDGFGCVNCFDVYSSWTGWWWPNTARRKSFWTLIS